MINIASTLTVTVAHTTNDGERTVGINSGQLDHRKAARLVGHELRRAMPKDSQRFAQCNSLRGRMKSGSRNLTKGDAASRNRTVREAGKAQIHGRVHNAKQASTL